MNVGDSQETSVAIVVTTIFPPTEPMRRIALGAGERGFRMIVAGDSKGPDGYALDGVTFLSLADQRDFSQLGRLAPTNSYARKNLGYLWAMRSGADVVLETDDDNMPTAEFFSVHGRDLETRIVPSAAWVNAYQYFIDAPRIWPRGLPLEYVQTDSVQVAYGDLPTERVDSPIQQGLADGDPDVDAVYRMVGDIPVSFVPGRSIGLPAGSWCPFNSQNTTWHSEAFQLMYLPSYCTFRMTDIWRSFVAQRVAWANGWCVVFHSPDVAQDRNEHSLLDDFRDEIPGYLHNAEIAVALSKLDIRSGVDNIGDAMRASYLVLVDMGLVGEEELDLLDLWLEESSAYLT